MSADFVSLNRQKMQLREALQITGYHNIVNHLSNLQL